MASYNIIAQSEQSTVVAEYKPTTNRSDAYQSEVDLEREFIRLLCEQGYHYVDIHNEQQLVKNLREQLEILNKYKFSDGEWIRFFNECIANSNDGIVQKTIKIQEDNVQVLHTDSGLTKNITLIDKVNIHNNRLQVINQYETSGAHNNRYDVTILVNGLPMIHIELKRRGVAIKEAFNQINRYQRDSFWANSGLFEYVQIFVISNGTNTKYYSNTTRYNHIKDYLHTQAQLRSKTSNSFEFTSFWADGNNQIIPDLVDFTKTFFARHTILSILTKYCVFTSEKMLLVMRPYQIVATERILNRIEIANNYKKYGSIDAGGYIWHTTGSGKTLTSFKTAQLASKLNYIDKVLFVVDRKDLDYQTMKEYDKFEKGCANSNTSTSVLRGQLEKPECKIIITTIQKLSIFVTKNAGHQIFDKPIVIIFDECHRSQFGEMHIAITKAFKKYYLFGFTGTPIFSVNASASGKINLKTTEQAFGAKLHAYTIVDAINDKNVLPFRVDYVKTMDKEPDIDDVKVWDIDRDAVWNAPERIKKIVEYILTNFNRKTYRNEKTYFFNSLLNIEEVANVQNGRSVEEMKQKLALSGFNSILCVSSIQSAKLYYNEFKRQMDENPNKKLQIATIFSYGANEEEVEGLLGEENSDNTISLDESSRDFLDKAINDYNKTFGTSYDTSSQYFPNYYKDISLRMKNKQIDLLIVVNMFLTGFDATTLNTLWVDKNLKSHGLIQAYSRTNRILNSIKTFGNIVCFRNLQKRTDDAISLFGDKEAGGLVLVKGFNDYYQGYIDKDGSFKSGYLQLIQELTEKFPLSQPCILGEKAKKEFIVLFGAILRMRNLLSSFDEFQGKEILTEREFQDYTGRYLDIRDEFVLDKEKENINQDIVFEVELIKQIEINIDYILLLVKKYHDSHCKDKEILISIQKAVDSSFELRSKKQLIETFIAGINDQDDVLIEWRKFIVEEKESQLAQIIKEEMLNEKYAREFVENSFRDGIMRTTGTDIDKLMPPMSRFNDTNREHRKKKIINKLLEFFNRFFGLGS